MLDRLLNDLRYSMRALGRDPSFFAVAVLSIAAGVGATTALFSVVNALWLRPGPVADPSRVGFVYSRPVTGGVDAELLPSLPLRLGLRLRELREFKDVAFQVQPVTPMMDWAQPSVVTASRERLASLAVSHNYFAVLGVPLLGRGFGASDEWGDGAVAVIGASLARRLYGEAGAALGQSLATTRGAITIIGVAPKAFTGPRLEDRIEIWLPLGSVVRFSLFPADLTDMLGVAPIVRLGEGVRWEELTPRLREVLGTTAHVRPLAENRFLIRSDGSLVRQSELLIFLWVAAGLSMFAGAANLATAMFARVERRRHELAMRTWAGASAGNLLALFAYESAILITVATPVAILVGWGVCEYLGRHTLPGGFPVAALGISIDWRVAGFALVMTLLAVASAAMFPVRYAGSIDLAGVLARSKGSGDRRSVLVRQAILCVHIAISITLLTGAVSLVGQIGRLLYADQGLALSRTYVVRVSPSFAEYAVSSDDAAGRQESDFADVLEQIAALPGVASVSFGGVPVASEVSARTSVRPDQTSAPVSLLVVAGGPAYADAIGARIVEGRDLQSQDLSARGRAKAGADTEAAGGALLELSAARALWPGGSAVGRTLRIAGRPVRVVGVFAELLSGAATRVDVPVVVVGRRMSAAVGQQMPSILVRTSFEAPQLVVSLASVAQAAFLGTPSVAIQRLDSVVEAAMANEYMGATVFSWFGTAAAVLGVAGIYGIVLFVVTRQRRDIAVRRALGGSTWQVAKAVLWQPIVCVSVGTSMGVVLSYLGSTLLDASIVGLERIHSGAYFLSAGAFVAAALAASWVGSSDLRHSDVAQGLRAD